ncbi:OsmC family protein [Variovorax sp. J22R133]|uniref:OsmC family protein n=1 Tax=Variovorax brevis TaxID=3053503 RepID=UPI0025761B34|nr:OsmC family protein [Variovorax sp. J22R133]MDM0112756.1 OsmC family protein [Variovorax sp. J22R133]
MSTTQEVAAALQRVEDVFRRRPETGLHDDAPATARWTGGLGVDACHANGIKVPTDMPGEFGGHGNHVTPGWLFRAGLATCATSCIAMAAAAEGIELTLLEVRATSRTDGRGMLGMLEANGARVNSSPRDVQLHVRIAAKGESEERLRAVVDKGVSQSPVPSAARQALPLAIDVVVDAA